MFKRGDEVVVIRYILDDKEVFDDEIIGMTGKVVEGAWDSKYPHNVLLENGGTLVFMEEELQLFDPTPLKREDFL